MYCKNCGKKLGDTDKFCSACGARVTIEPEEKPAPKAQRKSFHITGFNWDLDGFPTTDTSDVETKKDNVFNWSSVMDEQKRSRPEKDEVMTEDELFVKITSDSTYKSRDEDTDFDWNLGTTTRIDRKRQTRQLGDDLDKIFVPVAIAEAEEEAAAKASAVANAQSPKETDPKSFLEELAAAKAAVEASREAKAKEAPAPAPAAAAPEKAAEAPKAEQPAAEKPNRKIDKFYTFNRKSEEFQALLDQEYERLRQRIKEESEAEEMLAAKEEKLEQARERWERTGPQAPITPAEDAGSHVTIKSVRPKHERKEEAPKEAEEDLLKELPEMPEEAPAAEPIAEEAPVIEPVIEEAPVEEPVVEEAPVEEPIVEEAPAEEPVAEEAPAAEPIIEEVPAEEPVTEETPAEEPAAEETPAEEPVAEEVPAEEPATEEAPAEEPVTEETPAEEPAAAEIPAEELISRAAAEKEARDAAAELAAEEAQLDAAIDALLAETGEAPVLEEEPAAPEVPAEETVIEEAPAAEAPEEEPVIEETPAEEPVVEEIPEEEPTAEETPAEEPVAEEAPAEEPAPEVIPVEVPGEEEQPPFDGSADRKIAAEQEEGKKSLHYTDIFAGDDDDDDDDENQGKGKLILLDIIIVLLAICVVISGILVFAEDSAIAQHIRGGLDKIISIFQGDEETPEEPPSEDKTPQTSVIQNAIQSQKDRNMNGNITEILENTDLAFDASVDYGVSGLSDAADFIDTQFYTNDEGKTVNLSEELVGTTIEYFSSLVERMNNGDDAVLKLIDEESDLYKQVNAMSGDGSVTHEMSKLRIGELRGSDGKYFLIVKTTESTDGGEDEGSTRIVSLITGEKEARVTAVTDIK